MSILDYFASIFIQPKRQIGNYTAKITVRETGTDDLEITQHPVQQGASITDHAYKRPCSLAIDAIFDKSQGDLAGIYSNLLDLQKSRIPFDIVTGKRMYTNMLMKSLSQTNDQDNENRLSIHAEFQNINVVPVTVTNVPERKKQKNPGKTGKTEAAGAKKTETGNSSVLKKISNLF